MAGCGFGRNGDEQVNVLPLLRTVQTTDKHSRRQDDHPRQRHARQNRQGTGGYGQAAHREVGSSQGNAVAGRLSILQNVNRIRRQPNVHLPERCFQTHLERQESLAIFGIVQGVHKYADQFVAEKPILESPQPANGRRYGDGVGQRAVAGQGEEALPVPAGLSAFSMSPIRPSTSRRRSLTIGCLLSRWFGNWPTTERPTAEQRHAD